LINANRSNERYHMGTSTPPGTADSGHQDSSEERVDGNGAKSRLDALKKSAGLENRDLRSIGSLPQGFREELKALRRELLKKARAAGDNKDSDLPTVVVEISGALTLPDRSS